MGTKQLSKNDIKTVFENISAFDIIGNKDRAIAIIEIPASLSKRKKIIAQEIMNKHKNVKTVLEKKSPRSGVFRIRKYRVLLGEKNTLVTHKESGCSFKVDPRKMYFSTREGTERLRLANQVRDGEKILVFFSGIGAFPIIISKRKRAEITAIEINPAAVKLSKENTKINKSDIKTLKGDVKKIMCKEFRHNFDRVVMPLPESAINFMKEASYCLKDGGVCNFYCFSKKEELYKVVKKIESKLKNRKIKVLGIQKVLPWGPRIYKYRLDFRINSI